MKSMLALTLLAALAAPALAADAPAAAAKPDLAKGEAISKQVCAACHTADGTRGTPANPIIAGQHRDYLFKQLAEFKEGKRLNPVMQGMVAPLSEADLKNVAAFYAAKDTKPGVARNKQSVTLGEKIYRGGIADKQVPACAGCHSPSGAGIPAQYPRLGGQHADYTEAQLMAFRDGKRGNSTQMQQVAQKMSDREIRAVADYMAGLR
ncbi:cytochrome c4 [Aquincola sp. S2]|uniref:Cytochrome c4 n=1 Tax=Pseudaquabacterium terrae TaxID=2732868 RepID=A0ABX2ETD7_9BURK|nr:c-type cytochrome [Aquabacterium terrae]NRF71901.1 cytochrome c4 [Aquabacterium terrae]